MKRERKFQISNLHSVLLSICLPICLLLSSCSTIRYVPIQGENIVVTEIKEVIRDSIIYVEIEKESHSSTLETHRDTLSVLDNRYSVSTAEVNRGTLKHTLVTKQDSLPVKVVYKDILRTDSVYVEKPVITEVEVPIRDKTFWISIIINISLVFLIILAIVIKIKRVV